MILRLILIFAVAVLAGCQSTATLPAFQSTSEFEELVYTETLDSNVRLYYNAPADFSPRKQTTVVLYALPNGNSTEWTFGRRMEEGLDWHYDIQHIGAQTRLLRSVATDTQWIVVYLEANPKSWPTWRKNQENSGQIILDLIQRIDTTIPGNNKDFVLTGHSGGGSFTFGMLNAVDEIPANISRIALLDSNYGFAHDDGHGEKLLRWLKGNGDRRLYVLAYDDRHITYDGKPVVSPTGGTWRATHRMVDSMGESLGLESKERGDFLHYGAPQVDFFLHRNSENKILHTVLVERNGFANAMVRGGEAENRVGELFGTRAYEEFIGTVDHP